MNMLVQFGVGLIFNAIQGNAAEKQQKEMQAESDQQMQEFQAQLQQGNDELAQMTNPGGMELADPFAPDQPQVALNGPDAPPFPEEAANNMQAMQAQHGEEMATLSDQFLQNSTALKSQFLSENHLATETAEPTEDTPAPTAQVALDEEGKPKVESGAEQAPQKEARENYESDTKSQLSDQHATQTQQFMGQEKQNVQSFLDQNAPDLSNPAVQGELHKLLASSQKRALQLQTSQEQEMLKHDAYTPDMQANVDNYISNKSQLQQKQSQIEEDSDDAAALYQHQQDLAGLLQQKREELNEYTQENTFLKGPPNFNANSNSPTDVAKVLPPYLAQALYGMGIYQV